MAHQPKPARAAADFFEFGPFRLDVLNRSLYCSGEYVPLTPKVFETLLLLVEEAGRVVDKEQLMQRVWPDAFVEEGSITNNISTLRKILNPHFEGDGPIATVARRGYRFTAGVQLRNESADIVLHSAASPLEAAPAQQPATTEAQPPAKTMKFRMISIVAGLIALAVAGIFVVRTWKQRAQTPTVAARPSVAVLSMKNLSGKSQDAWLSTALTETITAELMAGGQLRLISGDSVAQMQQELAPPPGVGLDRQQLDSIGRNLGCDMVLTGDYLVVGDKIRVDIRLDDLASQQPVASVSETQDQKDLLELVSRAGDELRSKLGVATPLAGQADAVRASFSSNAEAQQFYFQGLHALRLRDGPRARDLFTQAISADPNFALAHSALSATWRLLGYDTRGAEEARRALDLSERLSREDRLAIEAQYYEASSDWSKAIEKYQALWSFFPDNIEYGLRLGNVQQLGGRYKDALTVIAQMRALPAPLNADPRIDLLESTVDDLLSDRTGAMKVVSQAVEKAKASNARLLLARARVKQAIYDSRLGKPDEAFQYLAEARQIFQSLGDTGGVVDTMRWDAVVLIRRGQAAEANKELESALALSQSLNYVRLTTAILLVQAETLRVQGQLSTARTKCEQALALAQQAENKPNIGHALLSLGVILKLQGEYTAARAKIWKSAEMAGDLGEKSDRTNALNSVAVIDLSQGRLQQARSELEEILPIDRQIGDKISIALRLNNLSRVLRTQGDLAGAEKLNIEECQMQEALNAKPALAGCRIRLAVLWMAEGRSSDARAAIDKVTSDFKLETLSPGDLASIASLQLAVGEQEKAAATLAETRHVLSGRSYITEEAVPVAIAAARLDAAQGHTATAVKHLEQAKSEAQKLDLLPLVLEARLAMAEIAARSGDRSEAAAIARDATQAGFGLIAGKANALAHSQKH
jgi:DNA-binding winged helix-turn-helix (wHTH) protein/tetratricopeptide (TPR) repeat protein